MLKRFLAIIAVTSVDLRFKGPSWSLCLLVLMKIEKQIFLEHAKKSLAINSVKVNDSRSNRWNLFLHIMCIPLNLYTIYILISRFDGILQLPLIFWGEGIKEPHSVCK